MWCAVRTVVSREIPLDATTVQRLKEEEASHLTRSETARVQFSRTSHEVHRTELICKGIFLFAIQRDRAIFFAIRPFSDFIPISPFFHFVFVALWRK